MEEWVKVAKAGEIESGKGKKVSCPGGQDIAVFNVEGEFFAINHTCPHKGGPLGEAEFVDKYVISCPLHGWTFDIRTGKCPDKDSGVQAHDVKIENGEIMVGPLKNCEDKEKQSSCCGGGCCRG